MHKHLKQELVPADHINTALSAGIGEIIDVAMAKKREERYASTEDMLEDLKAVAKHQPPQHARRAIDLDSLAKVEETVKTVDLEGQDNRLSIQDLFTQPPMIALLTGLIISIVLNLVLLVMWLVR
jgi:serine/threonine-protein kinase